MRKFKVLSLAVLALILTGCGGSKSTPAPTAASWVGTWSGHVDWVPFGSSSSNPSAGDNVTITIAPQNAPNLGCVQNGTCVPYQTTGTDLGPILGNVQLSGSFHIFNAVPTSADQNSNALVLEVVGDPYNPLTENMSAWQLSGNSITITTVGGNGLWLTLGTLTKQ